MSEQYYDLEYQKSPHYGYACDIARDGKAKTVTELLEKVDSLEKENYWLGIVAAISAGTAIAFLLAFIMYFKQ